MYKDKFILSVMYDGHPVRETGPNYAREVAIPFNSEYQIRLKNKNDRACTARVFIDGRKVSQLGDFIVQSGSSLDLERFVDRSMSEGKKFKFVPLDDPAVDDPSSSDNGEIRVEFRLAKSQPVQLVWTTWHPPIGSGQTDATWRQWDYSFTYDNVTYSPKNLEFGDSSCSTNILYCCDSSAGAPFKRSKSVDPGATVEGGHSSQQFYSSNLEVEDCPAAILKLKIVGLQNKSELRRYDVNYCSKCGRRVGNRDRYCSGCGCRL